MKRKLIIGSIILLSAIMIAYVSNTLQLLFKEELSAIINTNIEALADDENEYPIGSGPSLRLENDECNMHMQKCYSMQLLIQSKL